MTSYGNSLSMTTADRRAELAEILATGYLRLLVQRRISSGELDRQAETEAPCDRPVNATENQPQTEEVT